MAILGFLLLGLEAILLFMAWLVAEHAIIFYHCIAFISTIEI
jgi:hypothetical protein